MHRQNPRVPGVRQDDPLLLALALSRLVDLPPHDVDRSRAAHALGSDARRRLRVRDVSARAGPPASGGRGAGARAPADAGAFPRHHRDRRRRPPAHDLRARRRRAHPPARALRRAGAADPRAGRHPPRRRRLPMLRRRHARGRRRAAVGTRRVRARRRAASGAAEPRRRQPGFLHERRPLRHRPDLGRPPLGDGTGDGGRRALMATPVSLLVVNYRSAALARDAIRSARATTRSPLQVVVVDNSDEADALRSAADVVISSGRNAGYAAAINRGRRACNGEVIVAANPDVIFADGAIDALVAANAAVAGPALFWDDAHEWLLPPAALHDDMLERALATRFRFVARRRDRRRTRARIAFWSLTETTPVRALSGAVLAIRATAFDDAGGFDERFPLYFEENDFLRRVRGDIVYVPAARVRHIYNQSAGASPEAAAMYAQSEAEYLRKWGGTWAKRLELGARASSPAGPAPSRRWRRDAARPAVETTALLVEASPLPDFETAAGHFPKTWPVTLPEEVVATYRSPALHLRIVDRRTGNVLAKIEA